MGELGFRSFEWKIFGQSLVGVRMRLSYGIFCAFSQALCLFVSALFVLAHIFHLVPFKGNPNPAPDEMAFFLLIPFGISFLIGIVAARKVARGMNLAFCMVVLLVAEVAAHAVGVEVVPEFVVVLAGVAVGACGSATVENTGSVAGFLGALAVGYLLSNAMETSGEEAIFYWQNLGGFWLHVPMIFAIVVVAVHVTWGVLAHSGEDDPGDSPGREIGSIISGG